MYANMTRTRKLVLMIKDGYTVFIPVMSLTIVYSWKRRKINFTGKKTLNIVIYKKKYIFDPHPVSGTWFLKPLEFPRV